jgi:hypothetical protein
MGKLNTTEKRAWDSFECACSSFLEIKMSENYVEIVEELLSTHRVLGCNKSSKLDSPQSHLNFFPRNMKALSDEHGERFH